MKETERQMNIVYTSNAPSYRTINTWFSRFRTGEFSVEDRERSGRPSELDLDKLRDCVEADPFQSTRDMATALGVSQRTIVNGLTSIGKTKKFGRYIPHELTQWDMDRRVDASISLLTLSRRFDWLDSIVTGDEKWVYYENHHRKAQWTDVGEPAEDVPKPNIHMKKVMLCVWWSSIGIAHWELLPEGATITADVYTKQLQTLKKKLQTAAWKDKHIYFQHDNARPHVAKKVKSELATYGWTVLPHPPYSPDIAPSDYHLFKHLTAHLEGRDFKTRGAVEAGLKQFFNSRSSDFYSHGIHKLRDKWQYIVDNNGKYCSD